MDKIKKIIERLIESNNRNYDTNKTAYDLGYTNGVHDGLLDVLKQLGIDTDEEYYN